MSCSTAQAAELTPQEGGHCTVQLPEPIGPRTVTDTARARCNSQSTVGHRELQKINECVLPGHPVTPVGATHWAPLHDPSQGGSLSQEQATRGRKREHASSRHGQPPLDGDLRRPPPARGAESSTRGRGSRAASACCAMTLTTGGGACRSQEFRVPSQPSFQRARGSPGSRPGVIVVRPEP